MYEFFTQVVPKAAADGTFTAASFDGVDSWLRWLPPGLAAHAIQDASDGHPGTALLRLALVAAVIVVLGWLWVRSLSRALVTADTTTQSSRVHGAALPLARYGLRGAVTARFWIYQRREPMSLVFWAMTAVIMAAVSIRALLGPHGHPAFVLASAVFGAGFVGYFHADTAGLTGPPFVIEATALTGRRELRAYFSGQDIALGVIAVPLLTAISFGLAAVAKHPGGSDSWARPWAWPGWVRPWASATSSPSRFPTRWSCEPAVPCARPPRDTSRTPVRGRCSSRQPGRRRVAASPVIVAGLPTSSDHAAVRIPVLCCAAAAYGIALAWQAFGSPPTRPREIAGLCQVATRSKL